MAIIFTKHADEAIQLRNLKKSFIKKALIAPDIVGPARGNKKFYLKDFGHNYVKVIAVKGGKDIFVITTYWPYEVTRYGTPGTLPVSNNSD